MSADNVTQLRPTTDEYFGGCPICGKSSGYLNRGREHWGICDAHKVKWWFGENLFSDWKGESEVEQFEAACVLATYREVKPIHPTQPTLEQQRLDDVKYHLRCIRDRYPDFTIKELHSAIVEVWAESPEPPNAPMEDDDDGIPW